jgi:hypothetical protein
VRRSTAARMMRKKKYISLRLAVIVVTVDGFHLCLVIPASHLRDTGKYKNGGANT